jgi:hypothetical protein
VPALVELRAWAFTGDIQAVTDMYNVNEYIYGGDKIQARHDALKAALEDVTAAFRSTGRSLLTTWHKSEL